MPCSSYGGWTTTKGSLLRWACYRLDQSVAPRYVSRKSAKVTAKIRPESLETAADNRRNWWCIIKSGIRRAEDKREKQWHNKRKRIGLRASSATTLRSAFLCRHCDRDCHSKIGWRCPKRNWPVLRNPLSFETKEDNEIASRTSSGIHRVKECQTWLVCGWNGMPWESQRNIISLVSFRISSMIRLKDIIWNIVERPFLNPFWIFAQQKVNLRDNTP